MSKVLRYTDLSYLSQTVNSVLPADFEPQDIPLENTSSQRVGVLVNCPLSCLKEKSMERFSQLVEKLKGLSDVQIVGLHTLLIVGWIFLGMYLAPKPSKDDICAVEFSKIKTKDVKISDLEEEVAALKLAVDACEDRCGVRLRDEVDLQEQRYNERTHEALKNQKARLAKFRCDRCKRQGLCK